MAYSTVQKIRDEAGFSGNQNITDTLIGQYQTRAFAEVQSFISQRYTLVTFTSALFTGSQAASLLELIETLLAAGRLMMKEYAGQPVGETDGKSKIDEAKSMMKDIIIGNIGLLDVNGVEFPRLESSSSGSGPISQTNPIGLKDDPTSSERKFSVDDQY